MEPRDKKLDKEKTNKDKEKEKKEQPLYPER